MSIWSYVNGSIRIECFKTNSIRFNEIFKTVEYNDPQIKWDMCNVPCGSEGSLKVDINTINPEFTDSFTGITSFINIYGNLRDFDDNEQIIEWFVDLINNKFKNVKGVFYANITIDTEKSFVSVLLHNGEFYITIENDEALAAKYTLLNKYHIHII